MYLIYACKMSFGKLKKNICVTFKTVLNINFNINKHSIGNSTYYATCVTYMN